MRCIEFKYRGYRVANLWIKPYCMGGIIIDGGFLLCKFVHHAGPPMRTTGPNHAKPL